ncbi:protein couch potato [Trichuris trichiura]|uniref:Protein couch potato n=1 Tax=Trichuris trichiura TaxID=36087 RepID=A0A077ZB76_TRITR|nr:protein couch potato [Trichuris trichiura]
MNGTLTTSQSMDSVNINVEEEVRTLFVSGLPLDTKPRELYLLFRGCQGYESSLLKVTQKSSSKLTAPIGFVTFTSRQSAEEARLMMQARSIGEAGNLPQAIRLEFARSNTKVSRQKQASPANPSLPFLNVYPNPDFVGSYLPTMGHDLFNQTALASYAAELGSSSAFSTQAFLQGLQAFQVHPYGSVTGHPIFAANLPHVALPATNSGRINYNNSNNQSTPCSTLFVANLSADVKETELREVFGSFPGFQRLKMLCKQGYPIAFAEYATINEATHAMNALQGFVLLSSDRGPLRIEYARSRMPEVANTLAYPLRLARLEKTNEMLEHFFQLSSTRIEPIRKELLSYVQLLTEMKRNLDFIYNRIRKYKEMCAEKSSES